MLNLRNKSKAPVGSTSVWNRFSLPMHSIAKIAQTDIELSQDLEGKITPEQIVRGILSNDACNGYRLLLKAGYDPRIIYAHMPNSPSQMLSWPPAVTPVSSGIMTIRFSTQVAELINSAAALAKQFGHLRVGTEHVLLAILAEPASTEYIALMNAGVTAESCKSALGSWLMSGTYQLEAAQNTDPSVVKTPGMLRVGLVYRVRQYAQIAYVIGIVGLFFSRYIDPSFGGPALTTALDIILAPLMFFIWPYFFSSYALSYLLNTRARNRMVGAPISAQFQGIGLPLTLAIFTGFVITLGAIAGVVVIIVSSGRWLGAGSAAAIGFALAAIMEVIVWTLTLTHWLLTFDVRGKAV